MKKKSVLVMQLCCVMVGASFAACGGEVITSVDESKTQVVVSTFAGGLGTAWLHATAEAFNAQSDKYQIVVDEAVKDDYGTISSQIEAGTSQVDLYFNVSSSYETLAKYGYLEDISDLLAKKPDGETGKTVLEKMKDSNMYMDYYTFTDGKVYALPFSQLCYGISIDYTLFEEKGWLCTDSMGNVTLGADGVKDTWDDGWPVNTSEFDAMLNRIIVSGYTPFNFSQKAVDFLKIYPAIWAIYDGVQNFELTYSYSGTYTNGSTSFEITPKTGELAYDMLGLEKALEYANKYFANSAYTTATSEATMTTHTQAQDYYIKQAITSLNYEKCAMHIDGEWWENEAKGTFNLMEKTGYTEYKWKTRDYRFMPWPMPDGALAVDGNGGGTVLAGHEEGNFFIKKQDDSDKGRAIVEGAKEFAVYTLKDEMLGLFTINTGSVRPYDYTITDEVKSQMSSLGQSVHALKTSSNTYIVHPAVRKSVYSKLITSTTNLPTVSAYSSQIGGVTYTEPYVAFSQNKATVAEYLAAVKTYNRSRWESIYALLP